MGVISQNGIDYPVPSVPVQSDAQATDLIDNAVQTGQTLKSYLNSNFGSVKTKAFLNAGSIVIDLDRAPSIGHPFTFVLFNFNTANQNFIVCGNNEALDKVWGASTFTFTFSLSGNTLTITPNGVIWGLTIAMWGQN